MVTTSGIGQTHHRVHGVCYALNERLAHFTVVEDGNGE
jgi:hypothetical protein